MSAIEVIDDRHPWEKQPDESPQAYMAWLAYRDMGAGRSLARLADEQGKTKSWAEDLSRRHRWQARLDAWLLNEERERAVARHEAIREAERENAIAGRALKGKGLRALQELPADKIAPQDIPKFIGEGIRIEGQAIGMFDFGGKALGPTQAEIVAAFRSLTELALSFIPADRHGEFIGLARAAMTGAPPAPSDR